MTDLWVEVRTGEKRYYWNASKEDVLWDPPPGVRVVWAAEKHQETGKTYYWNKETSESVWTLPIPKNEGTPSAQQPSTPGTVGGSRQRQERWADVRDGPENHRLEDFAPEASAGQRMLGLAGRPGPVPCGCGAVSAGCKPSGYSGNFGGFNSLHAGGGHGGCGGYGCGYGGCGGCGGRGGCGGCGGSCGGCSGGCRAPSGGYGPTRGYDGYNIDAPRPFQGVDAREERQWWKGAGGGDYEEWWAQCRQRFLHEVGRVRTAHAASSQVWEMLPEEVDARKLAVVEFEGSASAASVFPPDFCIAGIDPDGPGSTGIVSPGFLVAAFADSPYDVADAVWNLSQTWWALVKATTRLVTLVFVTGLGGHGEADADEETSFLELQRRCLMKSPAPLIFAAQRLATSGGKRPRLLGGWQVSRVHRNQADEWLNPGSRSSWWSSSQTWGSKVAPPRGGRRARAIETYDYDEDWEDTAWENWDGDSEERLLESVTSFLGDGPKEVQELASMFAGRFNAVVRSNPRSGYSMTASTYWPRLAHRQSEDKKNDGSFKRWLLGAGFEASALFDRNKCMISLPHAKRTTRGTRGGRKNRGADRATISDGEQDGFFDPPHGLGSAEAMDLEEEVISHLREHGECDMGALRQVNDLGRRFNEVFFHKSKVNDGSWKKWLASMDGVEVAVDPKVAAYHGNKPTVVRLK